MTVSARPTNPRHAEVRLLEITRRQPDRLVLALLAVTSAVMACAASPAVAQDAPLLDPFAPPEARDAVEGADDTNPDERVAEPEPDAAPGDAQSPPSSVPVLDTLDIPAAIARLNDADYEVRERATRELWQAGERAEAALHEATRSEHPELAHRARAVLFKFQWGVYPDTPDDVLQMIAQYREAGGHVRRALVEKLLSRESPGVRALIKISRIETDDHTRRTIDDALRLRAAQVVPVLLLDGKEHQAAQLLEGAAAGGNEAAIRHYAAFLALRGELDALLQQGAGRPGLNAPDAKLLAYLHRARGDWSSAVKAAEASGDGELVENLLFEAGDWEALAAQVGADASARAARGEQIGIETLGFAAAYLRLENRPAEFDRLMRAVADDDAQSPMPIVEILLLNDRPEEAVQQLLQHDLSAEAFALLAALARFDQAIALAMAAPPGTPAQHFQLELDLARAWQLLGEAQRCREVIDALMAREVDWADPQPLFALIAACSDLGMAEAARAQALRALEGLAGSGREREVFAALLPQHAERAAVWWGALRRKNYEPPPATLKRVELLVTGRMSDADFEQAIRKLADEAEMLPISARIQWLSAAGETLLSRGQIEQAINYLTRASELSSAPATLQRLGELLLLDKRYGDAAETFERASIIRPTDPAPLLLRGHALVLAAQAAAAENPDASEHAGQLRTGRRLMDLALLLPLGDQAARYELIAVMRRQGLDELAQRQYELILRTGAFASWHVGQSIAAMAAPRALEQGDFAAAAVLRERYRLVCLHSDTLLTPIEAHLTVALQAHEAGARAALAAQEWDAAFAHAQACAKSRPGGTDVVIDVINALTAAGRSDQADGLFEIAYVPLAQVCRDYVNSAVYHNRAAWLAARCGRRLDEALRLAERAAALQPDEAPILDTLAEVHFRLGHREKAIELAKRCLELRPDSTFFRQQLERFETAGDR